MSEIIKIPLGRSGRFSIIDKDDWEKVESYSWGLKAGYAGGERNKDGKRIRFLMHRLLLGAKSGELVDHINRDKLDNRRCNLRICTPTENSQNCKSRNKFGFKGVGQRGDKRRKQFNAKLSFEGKRICLGNFYTAEDAARAYDDAIVKYYGDRARYQTFNFPERFYENRNKGQSSTIVDMPGSQASFDLGKEESK